MSLQFEEPDEPPTLTTAAAPPSDDVPLTSLFSAHRDAAMYDSGVWGQRNAMVDATENRVQSIKKATGEDVPNPYNNGYLDEAMASYASENPRFRSNPLDDGNSLLPSPYRPLTNQDLPRIDELQMQAFQSRLNALGAKYPDKAEVIGANRPISADARDLANAAEARADSLSSATSGLRPWAASFAGAAVGSFRDPLQVAALVTPGGPEIKVASVAGRIAVESVRQAIINAGFSALEQPAVQQWRAERGQESGVVPAVKDVGIAALFGAIPGAGIEAGKLGWGKVGPALAQRAASGDAAAAREVAAALPKDVVPEAQAAVESDRLDTIARGEPLPVGVTAGAIDAPYRQAIRNAEDPAEPLPEMAHPSSSGLSDETAIAAAQDAKTPMQAVDAIRGDPQALAASLASSDPSLAKVGQIASLGDEAYDLVRFGEASPAIAAEVASRVTDPADQAAILREVVEQRPSSAFEAAQLVSQAMERRALPTSQHIMLSADGPVERALSAPDIDRGEISGRSSQLAELERAYPSDPSMPTAPLGTVEPRASFGYEGTGYGDRTVSAQMHAPEIGEALGQDVPGTMVRPFDSGPEQQIAARLRNQDFPPMSPEYLAKSVMGGDGITSRADAIRELEIRAARTPGFTRAEAAIEYLKGLKPPPGPPDRPFGGPLTPDAPPGSFVNPNGIVAFHGTPHDFDRFDLGKIGTGEGAQAFGHGLYFAESKGLAERYRDTLSSGLANKAPPVITIDGAPAVKKVSGLTPFKDPQDWAVATLQNQSGDAAKAATQIRREFKTYTSKVVEMHTTGQRRKPGEAPQPGWQAHVDALAKNRDGAIDLLKSGRMDYAPGKVQGKDPGSDPQHPFYAKRRALAEQIGQDLERDGFTGDGYDANDAMMNLFYDHMSGKKIADTGPEWLKEGDDPLMREAIKRGTEAFDNLETPQPRMPTPTLFNVKLNHPADRFLDWDKALAEQPEHVQQALARLGGYETSATSPGALLYRELAGGRLGDRYTSDVSGPVAASDRLYQAGIPGIKYLDRSSRRAGEGTSNFVAFRDHDVIVTHKNGVELPQPKTLPEFLRGEAGAAFGDELKAAGIDRASFSGDLQAKAEQLLVDGRRMDYGRALEQAAREEAIRDGILSGRAQGDGGEIPAGSGTATSAVSRVPDESSELRRSGEAGSASGGSSVATEPGSAASGLAAGEQTPPASTGGGLEALDPSTINVDASRFQFKAGGDQAGVTDRLQGVQKWDPRLAGTALVWRDETGKNWIADGHQRLALAQRLSSEGQAGIRVNAFVLNEAEGVSDGDARVIAAVKNIAEGTGTPIDAAKIIRDAAGRGIDLPPLPPRSTLVKDGQALARLSPEAFGMAVNDVVPTNQAAIVGRMISDPAQQLEAMRVLAKAGPDNARQAELMVREIMNTGTEQMTRQGGLFGDEHFAASVVLERAKIADEALKQLARDRTTFKTLVGEAERIESHGANTLDTDANKTRLNADEQANQLLTNLATRKGPVSDALTDIARELKAGNISAAAAARDFLGAVRRRVEGGMDEGADTGGALARKEAGSGASPGAGEGQPSFSDAPVAEFLDTVPASARMDGRDTAPITRADMIAREPREGFLASLIAGCPGA